MQLDDQVDAQPLVVPVSIAGTTHQVVYVATESNSVYGIDATNGNILVQTNLGSPMPQPLGCWNNGPNVGITGTPVINGNNMFVIAYVNTAPPGSAPTPAYHSDRLNLSTLQDTVPPVTITASHTLTDGSTFAFNAAYQRQRAGLVELTLPTGNVVYAGFGKLLRFRRAILPRLGVGWHAPRLVPLPANSTQRPADHRPQRQPTVFPHLGLDVGVRRRQRRDFPLFRDRKFRLQLDGLRQSVPLQHDMGRRDLHPGERGSALERPCSGRRFHAVHAAKYV